MAITYAYPTVTPASQDLLVGTEIPLVGGEDSPRTRTFTVGSVVTLATTAAAASAASLYATIGSVALKANIDSPTFTGTVTIPSGASIGGYATLASPTFTGTVTIPSGASISGYALLASPTFSGTPGAPTAAAGNSSNTLATTAFVTIADNLKANLTGAAFTGAISSTSSVTGGTIVKTGGTINQYLMANGATSTDSQVLYKAVSTAYQTVAGSTAVALPAISTSVLTTGTLLKINTVVSTSLASVNTVLTEYFISSTSGNTTVGTNCFKIGFYTGSAAFSYYPMDRVLWTDGTNLYVRNNALSTQTSSGAVAGISQALISNISSSGNFYITVVFTTTGTDTAALSYVQVST